jgi:hypothetical protein
MIEKNVDFAQNHWVCGIFHRPELQITKEHNISETGSVNVFTKTEEDTYSVASITF